MVNTPKKVKEGNGIETEWVGSRAVTLDRSGKTAIREWYFS